MNEIQKRIFLDRYSFNGETEVSQAWERVARAVASGEANRKHWEDKFLDLLYDFKYVPGGRILASMGTGTETTASNCYVIPSPEDSRSGIMHSLTEWVEIQSKGGGVGINMSTLRPRGAPVKGVNGTSSGPVNWSQVFAFVSHDVIIQGGSRRGAAMIMLDISHPDVYEFISAKKKPGVLEGCNISVCVSDDFMDALSRGDKWELRFNGTVYKTVDAQELWYEICKSAWESGEPGIYFLERANKEANSWYFERLIASNPCGEQPLGPYGACLLGAFNLTQFMNQDGTFNFEKLAEYTALAVRFNDNVIDLSNYPLPQCRDSQQSIRRMGIGIMGLADVLIAMGIRYGSAESVKFTEQVFRTIRDAAYAASVELAKERGPFPKFDAGLYLQGRYIARLPGDIRKDIARYGIRNCYLLTQAPTGTTSLLAGVNSGIEPYFDFEYLRKDRLGEYDVRSKWADMYSSDSRPDFLVTAHDVTPEEHVAVQAAVQAFVDSAVSKTVNAPNSQTIDEVVKLYTLAYDSGLKSIAYYRDGSRQSQVLYRQKDNREGEEISRPIRRRLPDERKSITHKFVVGDQEGYLTVGMYEDGTPGELFIHVSKQGSTVNGLMDAVAILTSNALQYGVPLEAIANKLEGTRFEPSGITANKEIPFATSIVDYVFRWLRMKFLRGSEDIKDRNGDVRQNRNGDACPGCGIMMVNQEGCAHCVECGYSKC
jgi:ribonucleoside-diphosphate reductase alpha chain